MEGLQPSCGKCRPLTWQTLYSIGNLPICEKFAVFRLRFGSPGLLHFGVSMFRFQNSHLKQRDLYSDS